MQERRATERLRTDVKTRWEGLFSQGRGAICDLSRAGCFVLTGGEVTTGELVRLEIIFPTQIALVWGQVVYAVAEMGFALRFAFSDEDEGRAFHEVVETPN
jgi:PilZ domain